MMAHNNTHNNTHKHAFFRTLLRQIVIDVVKHAVLGKFNDIRPGIYREYMRDLCADSLTAYSHSAHRLVRLAYGIQHVVTVFL